MQTNLNVLQWDTDKSRLYENLWYRFGDRYCLVCPIGRFFPFQIAKDFNNREVESFTLRRLSDGTEYDILADMEFMGLTTYRNSYFNYPSDNIVSQNDGQVTGPTTWGFSIGGPMCFRYVRLRIVPSNASLAYHLLIKDASDGITLGQTGGTINGLTVGAENQLNFTLNANVENAENKNLWLELRMSHEFYFVGQDNLVADAPEGYPNEPDKYGTGGSVGNYAEATIDAPGGAGAYSGWVEVYGGTTEDKAVIISPSVGSLTVELTPGDYEAEFSDGETTWYSGNFTMVQDVSCFPKITWSQRENWDVDDYTRVYQFGYRDWLYPYSQGFIKPSYGYEQQVSTRGGREYKNWITSFKEGRFLFPCPEWLYDAVRTWPMMDDVKIEYNGKTYFVDFIIPNEPNWSEQGHLAICETTFRTGILHKTGNSLPPIAAPDELFTWLTPDGEQYETPDGGVFIEAIPETTRGGG